MLGLNLKGAGSQDTSIKVGFRSGWLRHIGVALSGAGGAAVALAGFEVLKTEPGRTFALLQSWGPEFLIAMLAILVVGKFMEGLSQTVRESFAMVASGVSASAEASSRTADALTRLAEQGGKQAQEVQRLAIYAAQEFPNVYDRFDKQDAMLEKLSQITGDLAKAVVGITVRGTNGD